MAQKTLHKRKAEIKIIIELLNSKSLKRNSVKKKISEVKIILAKSFRIQRKMVRL